MRFARALFYVAPLRRCAFPSKMKGEGASRTGEAADPLRTILGGSRRGTGFRRGDGGAQERTRTSTPLRAPAPEAGASTNSATWARGRGRELGGVPALVNAGAKGHGGAADFRRLKSDSHGDCH